jgi:hypothetical protein
MPTNLNPLEEHLFQAWTKANQVQNHDDPKNTFDHRGMFKSMNGQVHPPGAVNDFAKAHNDAADEAQQKQDDAKKAAQDHLKDIETKHQRELDIQKTHHTLQQLLVKKHLGL